MNTAASEAYRALYEHSGLLDLSSRGKIRVTGQDRQKVLQRLLTQDLRPLQPGQGRPAAQLNARGKVLSLLNVLVFDNSFLLDTDENCAPAALSSLEKLIITEDAVLNMESRFGHFMLIGPSSADILKAADIPLPPEPGDFFYHNLFLKESKECFVIRRESNTFELLVPGDLSEIVQNQLFNTGRIHGLQSVPDDVWEVFRIEQGLLRFGKDVSEEVTLPETGLDAALASSTKGCYPGQEVVARTNTYKGHARKMRALLLNAAEVPSFGSKIICGGADAGWITSACVSPKHKVPLALAYLNRNFFDMQGGDFEIGGVEMKVRVLPLEALRKSP